MKKHDWMIGPVIFFALIAVLLVVWAIVSPEVLTRNFDQGGYSPFELMTDVVFALIIPLVWWKVPFGGTRRRKVILCAAVSLVAIMAIAKELDLHLAVLRWLYPDFVTEGGSMAPGLFKPNGDALCGTPFKARVLTNGGVPIMMKCSILFYFVAFFGVFAIGFAYLFPAWIKGVLKFEAPAWAWGCFGASGVIIQIADRLPSWVDHAHGLDKHAEVISRASSLCTCLEEGGEMMLAIFALVTIYLGYRKVNAK